MIAAILQIIAVVLGFFKPKTTPAEAITKTANNMAKTSATVARQTQAQTDKEMSNVQTETAASVDRVRRTNGLRDTASAVQDAIDAANKQSGADD